MGQVLTETCHPSSWAAGFLNTWSTNNKVNLTDKGVRYPEVWIGIDFNQPNPKVLVDQEVVAKYLKHILTLVWVQLCLDA